MYTRFYKTMKSNSFFVFGPRATGKTTWLKAQFPEAQYIDLLNSEVALRLKSMPSRLVGMIENDRKIVVIDEIQKIPELLDEVHRLIEEKKIVFALTGSSARKLKRGGANLLGGRAIQTFFHPLTCWEMQSDFSLANALRWGMLPKAWPEPSCRASKVGDLNAPNVPNHQNSQSRKDVLANWSPNDFLSTYVYTYLKEEVLAEGLTRNGQAFSRFLEVMSFSQAQPITLANIAKDTGVDPKVVSLYLEILEDLLLGFRLPVFSHKAKRKMTAHPKFLYFDTGVFRTLRPKGPLDLESELDGPALETLWFSHYLALGEFHRFEQKLYFWRSAAQLEVDFVSYGPLGLFAFEMMRSSIVRHDDLMALKEFKKDYPVAKTFLLYGGLEETLIDGIQVIPYGAGLMRLPELLGLPGFEQRKMS